MADSLDLEVVIVSHGAEGMLRRCLASLQKHPAAGKARVTVVDRVADAASSTFGVRLEIANPGNRIPGGLKCKLRLGDGVR